MQHAFNEMLQHLRSKENEKNLAAQRLDHLKEKRSYKIFTESRRTTAGIEESISFTGSQLEEAKHGRNE
jgi:chromosome segregation protein